LVNIDSEELQDLISSTIDKVEAGMKNKGYHIKGCIDFDVAVVNMEKGQGGIKLYVMTLTGKRESENVTKIKFSLEKDKEPIYAGLENKRDWSKAIT
jgi:hypothetical protein